MKRLKLFIPLVIFAVMAGVFYAILQDEDYDPQSLPSALLGRAVPAFSLPRLLDGRLATEADLKGEVALLNVWATWCPTCRAEHQYLNQLAAQGVKIIGINYKDESLAARQWLAQLGNPYAFNIADEDGRLGLDLGVYGAPETYLLDEQGIIRFKHVGVVNEQVWRDKFLPLVQTLDPRFNLQLGGVHLDEMGEAQKGGVPL
jgi:cytochrome c biogenesis protein CcmG/thiol:disulfide interchange protein DsbE